MVYLLSLIGKQTDIYTIIIYILSTLAVVFLTLPVHEFAHALAAVKLGDQTPRYQGRLTINPFAHLDYTGMLCMILLGVGWAKPVQINARNFKNPKRGMALTAAAGPIANLIMAFIAMIIVNALSLLSGFGTTVYYFVLFVYYIANINVYLAVFNFIPIPPLDGSRLLSALLPDRIYYNLMRYEQYSFIALMVLIFALSRAGLDPVGFVSRYVLSGISYLANLPFSFIR